MPRRTRTGPPRGNEAQTELYESYLLISHGLRRRRCARISHFSQNGRQHGSTDRLFVAGNFRSCTPVPRPSRCLQVGESPPTSFLSGVPRLVVQHFVYPNRMRLEMCYQGARRRASRAGYRTIVPKRSKLETYRATVGIQRGALGRSAGDRGMPSSRAKTPAAALGYHFDANVALHAKRYEGALRRGASSTMLANSSRVMFCLSPFDNWRIAYVAPSGCASTLTLTIWSKLMKSPGLISVSVILSASRPGGVVSACRLVRPHQPVPEFLSCHRPVASWALAVLWHNIPDRAHVTMPRTSAGSPIRTSPQSLMRTNPKCLFLLFGFLLLEL
jgi:hypothetical protein